VKTCQCGCGEVTAARFLRGHNIKATRPSWWKGDDVGYRAVHTYLQKHFPKTGVCDECGETRKTDYALIKGRQYSRERADYRELCKRCHNEYDNIDPGRIRNERAALKRQEAGDAPRCRCGCDLPVGWDSRHSRWRSYAPGHYVGAARLLRKVSVGDAQ
jgi:hypothetical protein